MALWSRLWGTSRNLLALRSGRSVAAARPAAATTTAGATRVLVLGPNGYRHSRDRHLKTGETAGEGRTALFGSHTLSEVTADLRKIAKQTGISGAGRKTIPDSGKRLVRGETALRETAHYEERHRQRPTRGLRPRQLADRLRVHAHPHRSGSSLDLSLAWSSSSRLKCILGTAHLTDQQLDGCKHRFCATTLGHTLEGEVRHSLRGQFPGACGPDMLEDLS